MMDISACAQSECLWFNKCYRAQGPMNEQRQAYSEWTPITKNFGQKCDGFIEYHPPKKQENKHGKND